ncbi:DUF6173 family protein [Oscillatoria sp. FACHB-1406]|uniref:DUF6173 family protein n=1 Tax=Oscillatoria sp. FACHB-1406 TaxID=2692846 RepID=UPI0016844807|nr:DUF6173 family protein [Oscillatoria sp. FACHB-1406]MBD2578865.1 hypothetical protein [Oscillatoria sp. FACHB-1406]
MNYNSDINRDIARLQKKSDHLQKSTREGIEERSGYANVMYQSLLREIKEFESELKADEEVGAYIANLGGSSYLRIESISYRDPYYLILIGQNEDRRVKLVQHVTQINILFVVIKIKPEEDREPRRFGFEI